MKLCFLMILIVMLNPGVAQCSNLLESLQKFSQLELTNYVESHRSEFDENLLLGGLFRLKRMDCRSLEYRKQAKVLGQIAISLDRADIMYFLHSMEVSSDSTFLIEDNVPLTTASDNDIWELAERLELTDELAACHFYESFAKRLYRPNICHYRLGEILSKRGKLQQANQHFALARRYDHQLQSIRNADLEFNWCIGQKTGQTVGQVVANSTPL